MNLSREDAELFYRLMWRLQFYVNGRLKLLKGVRSAEEYGALPPDDRVKVRDALWEKPDLIDAYIEENPDALSPEELGIIGKWKGFVSGTFQIYRLLKKHAIFIGEKGQVYGVLGLLDNLEDVLLWRPLPVMAKAVLLPFKGQIIYDGLMITYSIYFGSGIRSTLHEAYMAAKQSGRIITSLEPDVVREERPARRKPEKDWGPLLDDLVQTAEGIKGGPAVQSSAFGVLRASARLAQAAAHRPQEHEELRRLAQNVAAALTRLRTALEREERYPAG